jgi:hypothetical protein
MKKRNFSLLILLLFIIQLTSTAQDKKKEDVRVFLDCNAWCPMQYVKTEITFVNFVPDQYLANVFVQVTSQSTGADGEEVKMFISGRENFKGKADTLRFFRNSVDTDEEYRIKFTNYLKLALVPFVSKTALAEKIVITVPQGDKEKSLNSTENTKDKWNFWVFNSRLSGNYSKDDFSKSTRYSASFSGSRTTEKLKLDAGVFFQKNTRQIKINNDVFDYPNDSYSMNVNGVVSINPHLSYGGGAAYTHSTFSNNDNSFTIKPAIEYSVFPYKEAVKKAITVYYEVGPVYNKYIDSSYYDKVSDNLVQQSLTANANFVQKWGNINIYAGWESFLNQFNLKGNKISGLKINNVSVGGYLEFRIFKGLSVYVNASADFTKGIYPNIRKADFSTDDILSNVRQYPTTNNFYSGMGINYRFGSIYNNVVNPRFNNRGGGNRFF